MRKVTNHRESQNKIQTFFKELWCFDYYKFKLICVDMCSFLFIMTEKNPQQISVIESKIEMVDSLYQQYCFHFSKEMEIFGMIFHRTELTLLLYEKEYFKYIFCFFHKFYTCIYCFVGTLKSANKISTHCRFVQNFTLE